MMPRIPSTTTAATTQIQFFTLPATGTPQQGARVGDAHGIVALPTQRFRVARACGGRSTIAAGHRQAPELDSRATSDPGLRIRTGRAQQVVCRILPVEGCTCGAALVAPQRLFAGDVHPFVLC